MSAYMDAFRQMLRGILRCPRCGAENSDRQPHHIELEGHSAACNACGFSWEPPELKR